MKKVSNKKIFLSLILSLIAICYVSLAISYAWFFANRSAQNSANNLKIVSFEGGLYYYKNNYDYEEVDGVITKTDYKGFQGNQNFSNSTSLIDEFEGGSGAIMAMPDMLPNVRFLYLVRLKHNFETTIDANFYINTYESYLGQKKADGTLPSQDDCPVDEERVEGNGHEKVSLSEAINIYIGNEALKLNDRSSLTSLENFVNTTTLDNEKFHNRENNKILTNIYQQMDTTRGGQPFLTSVSIPASDNSNEFYYVPIMFEFSDREDTYYRPSGTSGANENQYVHNTTGNSNVYKNLTFEINEFEITPYKK